MAMQTDIRRYGARPVEHQAVTVPGLQPQGGPSSATGRANQDVNGWQQQRKSTSQPSQSKTPATPLVFAQWIAEGLRKKKPELQHFLKTEQLDII